MEGIVYCKDPRRFPDDRGFFQEVYNGSRADPLPASMVQMNHSRSKKGVLRGMHWQMPNPTGKYVTCTQGRVLDVVVDIRKSSPTFKQWHGYELSEDVGQSLWVPEGFAHGFVTISPVADLVYLQTAPFSPEGDRCLKWNDPEIAIEWPRMLDKFIISEKDQAAPLLSELPTEALFD